MKPKPGYLIGMRRALAPLEAALNAEDHQTQALWALDVARRALPLFTDKYPDDPRPPEALRLGALWARGQIKMPVAKKAAHATHNAATAVQHEDPAAAWAARACGHAVGTVHVGSHAVGVAMYSILAMQHGKTEQEAARIFEEMVGWYMQRLSYWSAWDKSTQPWAAFMMRDARRTERDT